MVAGALAGVAASLRRLGAAWAAPRRAVRARLDGGPGGLAELIPWTLAAAAIERPAAFGQAILILRSELLAGLLRFVGLWSELVLPVLLPVALLSFVAPRLFRVDGADAFDALSSALVPLVLGVAGLRLLAVAGLEVRADFAPYVWPYAWLLLGLTELRRAGASDPTDRPTDPPSGSG